MNIGMSTESHCITALGALLLAACAVNAAVPTRPMPIPQEETAVRRWLNKPVKESRLLDDMPGPLKWTHAGIGAISFDGEPFAPGGPPTLRLISPTLPEKPNTASGRPFTEAVARRAFERENWNAFNRLSVYIRPDLPGFKAISCSFACTTTARSKFPTNISARA